MKISPEAELIVFGLLMLLVAVAMPDGIAGALSKGLQMMWIGRTGQMKPTVR